MITSAVAHYKALALIQRELRGQPLLRHVIGLIEPPDLVLRERPIPNSYMGNLAFEEALQVARADAKRRSARLRLNSLAV